MVGSSCSCDKHFVKESVKLTLQFLFSTVQWILSFAFNWSESSKCSHKLFEVALLSVFSENETEPDFSDFVLKLILMHFYTKCNFALSL